MPSPCPAEAPVLPVRVRKDGWAYSDQPARRSGPGGGGALLPADPGSCSNGTTGRRASKILLGPAILPALGSGCGQIPDTGSIDRGRRLAESIPPSNETATIE